MLSWGTLKVIHRLHCLLWSWLKLSTLVLSGRIGAVIRKKLWLSSDSMEMLHLVISNISTTKVIATQTLRKTCAVLWETTEIESFIKLLSIRYNYTTYSLVIPQVAVYSPISKLLVKGTLKTSSPMTLALWDTLPDTFSQAGRKKTLVTWHVLAKSAH